LLAQDQWFSPAFSTTKTGRNDIAEILLKVALITKNSKFKVFPNKPSSNTLLFFFRLE